MLKVLLKYKNQYIKTAQYIKTYKNKINKLNNFIYFFSFRL